MDPKCKVRKMNPSAEGGKRGEEVGYGGTYLLTSMYYFAPNLHSESVIRTLAHELHHFKLEKSEIGWHLEELETLAKEAPKMEEEEEEESSDDDDSDSDSDDTSSDDDDSSDEDESKDHKPEEGTVSEPLMGDDESLFIHEGPRPKIIEL